ncbi:MAG: DNA mismatch repair endonuclease MutL [Deltaproteobacteria bacterium]|nr:DNA mismatch repair endonuclease MutL [Deltaproteobacteria bacterium]
MSRIRVLPENVASQIAAGEVVERPASIVRELLDNSLDAAGDRIEVVIEAGGRKLVRVSDNGMGMDRDDLLLSLERHATSKVRALEDLYSIGTLGFRGEAIPSIASVSRLEIISRTEESLAAHRVRIDGGRLQSIEETGAPAGTVVAVRDLFFNTPARRKFLRTARTETHHVMETVSRIALPYRGISFRLREGDRTLLHYPASEKEVERLAMLLGRETAQRMEPVERASGPVEVRAHLAPPELSRSRADRILVYVNGRNVRDRLLTRAVMEGYGQRLMKGRYPQAVVTLEMDPSLVDINVHPTKQEVRFRDGRTVYRAVVSAVDEGLYRRGGMMVRSDLPKREAPSGSPSPSFGTAEDGRRYEPADRPESPRIDHAGAPVQQSFRSRPLFVIGQLRNTYILCQAQDGLLLVDQHAAHERVVYESLQRGARNGAAQAQPFLIPKRIELSVAEAGLLEAHGEALARLGLEVEPFGGTTCLLRSVPPVLVEADPDAFLRELLARLKETGGELESDAALDELLAVMACHGAVRAGKPLSEREMNALLDDLHKTELPTNCPHGRPVSRKITWGELERMFKRVV